MSMMERPALTTTQIDELLDLVIQGTEAFKGTNWQSIASHTLERIGVTPKRFCAYCGSELKVTQ